MNRMMSLEHSRFVNKFRNKWWGYVHVNGSLQAKRFFDKRDIEEALESDFVATVCGPFLAVDRDDALKKIEELIG